MSTTLQSTIVRLFLISLLSSTLAAQLAPPVSPGRIGFSISNGSAGAGDLCSGFRCQVAGLLAKAGEVLSFAVRTDRNQPFVVLVGPSSGLPCTNLPGIGNQWRGPSQVLFVGTTNRPDTIRCWGGLGQASLRIPASVQPRDAALFQVVANNGRLGPVFSTPVRVTITL